MENSKVKEIINEIKETLHNTAKQLDFLPQEESNKILTQRYNDMVLELIIKDLIEKGIIK